MSILEEEESTTTNTVNDDGSVTRVSTTTMDNGDVIVATHIIQADEYQRINDDIQQQIDDLTAQKESMQENMSKIQLIKSKQAITPPADNPDDIPANS